MIDIHASAGVLAWPDIEDSVRGKEWSIGWRANPAMY